MMFEEASGSSGIVCVWRTVRLQSVYFDLSELSKPIQNHKTEIGRVSPKRIMFPEVRTRV